MKYISLLAIFAVAIFLTGCNFMNTTEDAPMTDEQSSQQMDESTSESDDMVDESSDMDERSDADIVEMTVDMFGFGYTPDMIKAKPGQTLEITLTNSKGFHDFVIDELDVASEQINEGDTTTVTIQIPADAEPGTEYAYYCSVGNHRAQGMEGTLVIE